MKKIILTLMILSLTVLSAKATNVVVESLEDIDKNDINKIFSAKVLEDASLNSEIIFSKDAIFKGEIVKMVDAQRGKRSGYIVIRPVSLEYNGLEETFEGKNIEAKVQGYSKKSWKDTSLKAGVSAGLKVGNRYIPGFSQVFYFSKGLIKPAEDKTRLESAITSVYENSPFVYFNKGDELNINTGDMLVLKFYHPEVPKWRVLKRKY